ncbi:MAG: hypothetical protein COA88_13565 [Kordia sp.]|nr:MAG: hypothetical protein COA88_13565 [Kordia sp.]
MRKSVLKSVPFSKEKKGILDKVLSLTIYNLGTKDMIVYGQNVSTSDSWSLPPSNTVTEFDWEEVTFTGTTPTENKALIFHQRLSAETNSLDNQETNC